RRQGRARQGLRGNRKSAAHGPPGSSGRLRDRCVRDFMNPEPEQRVSPASRGPECSSVAPMFNEAENISECVERVGKARGPRGGGEFGRLERRVVGRMGRLPERSRCMKGLFAWVGFRQTSILYDRQARHKGRTKWNYWRLWNFALDGITSFSSIPLKVWSYVGVMVSLFAFLYALSLAGLTLIRGVVVPGYASIMAAVLFFGGVQLITLGIIGEYLSRM